MNWPFAIASHSVLVRLMRRPAHQADPAPRLGGLHQALDDLPRAVRRAVVHDDDLDGIIRRAENRPDARGDVRRLVAGGDDRGDERAARLGRVVAQLGAAPRVSDHEQHQDQDVPGGDEPAHPMPSPSRAATTAAPVRWPVTLVMVRNMSGTRSSPMSSDSPASGSPVAAKAGVRLTMLPEGTLATVSDARNTAAPAWNISGNPRATP